MPIAADLPDDIDALKQLVVARTAERDTFKVERDVIATERDVAVAERDVGDDEVRALGLDELHRLGRRRGLAADHQVRLPRHHVDDAAPHERMVFDDEDPHLDIGWLEITVDTVFGNTQLESPHREATTIPLPYRLWPIVTDRSGGTLTVLARSAADFDTVLGTATRTLPGDCGYDAGDEICVQLLALELE